MSHWTYNVFVDDASILKPELIDIDNIGEQEVHEIVSYIEQEFGLSPETVLDVGCGLGRHASAFADRGCDVLGIDISPEYLSAARTRATTIDEDGSVSFCRMDMRDLPAIDETFDLVVCLYNTFGYFDDEANIRVLREFRRHLSSDGICVVEVSNKDTVLQSFDPERIVEFDQKLVVERREYDSRKSRMKVTLDLLRGPSHSRSYEDQTEFDIRLYSPPELERRFTESGFGDVRIVGDYNGDPISTDKNRVVVFGRK